MDERETDASQTEVEVNTLDALQEKLWAEYTSGELTGAQRMAALSEIRKVVYLRSWLEGLINPGEVTE